MEKYYDLTRRCARHGRQKRSLCPEYGHHLSFAYDSPTARWCPAQLPLSISLSSKTYFRNRCSPAKQRLVHFAKECGSRQKEPMVVVCIVLSNGSCKTLDIGMLPPFIFWFIRQHSQITTLLRPPVADPARLSSPPRRTTLKYCTPL